ncbi:hypothetical protein E2C01_017022 [Portunus trituberculatus]|uniref:Uncharacterized protein n=1 Tax=Portunus trituberculatus TaxID=210409 RepID=A0A5B7DSH7_PORTR|nr:hypothetical protein [Portunus trituberculatus]
MDVWDLSSLTPQPIRGPLSWSVTRKAARLVCPPSVLIELVRGRVQFLHGGCSEAVCPSSLDGTTCSHSGQRWCEAGSNSSTEGAAMQFVLPPWMAPHVRTHGRAGARQGPIPPRKVQLGSLSFLPGWYHAFAVRAELVRGRVQFLHEGAVTLQQNSHHLVLLTRTLRKPSGGRGRAEAGAAAAAAEGAGAAAAITTSPRFSGLPQNYLPTRTIE